MTKETRIKLEKIIHNVMAKNKIIVNPEGHIIHKDSGGPMGFIRKHKKHPDLLEINYIFMVSKKALNDEVFDD